MNFIQNCSIWNQKTILQTFLLSKCMNVLLLWPEVPWSYPAWSWLHTDGQSSEGRPVFHWLAGFDLYLALKSVCWQKKTKHEKCSQLTQIIHIFKWSNQQHFSCYDLLGTAHHLLLQPMMGRCWNTGIIQDGECGAVLLLLFLAFKEVWSR